MAFLNESGLELLWLNICAKIEENMSSIDDAEIESIRQKLGELYDYDTISEGIVEMIESAILGVIDSAPDKLNTLKKIASAIGNDANFATTITNQLENKADKAEVNDAIGALQSAIEETLPITRGGTGATDAATARSNLEITPANIGALSTNGGTVKGMLNIQGTTDEYKWLRFFDKNGGISCAIYQTDATNGGAARLTIRQFSYDSSTRAPLSTYEAFNLPYVDPDKTYNAGFDILTTKSAVTIAQGGTGAADAATARTNLGITPANIGAAIARNEHSASLDNLLQTGFYRVSNQNGVRHNYGQVIVCRGGNTSDTIAQISIPYDNSGLPSIRYGNPSSVGGKGDWLGWYDFLTTKAAVTIGQGGTGATDAATARTNLGITPANIGAAPTSHASTATTYGAASASNYGHAMASSTTPKANGTAAVGSETAKFARGDHVHPLQTSVSGSSGSCTGNAATATKATQDGSGNTITSTYCKLSGGNLMSTPANGNLTASDVSGAWFRDAQLGACMIGRGNGDGATIGASGKANIFIKSWYGVGFVDMQGGKGVSVAIDCRTGNVAAASFSGSGASLTSLNASKITSGTLALEQGGTGANSPAGALTNLGLTATAAELNYCDGVTSNIQNQFNSLSSRLGEASVDERIENAISQAGIPNVIYSAEQPEYQAGAIWLKPI